MRSRKEEDGPQAGGRRGIEETCAQLEQLAKATDKDEKEVRAALRDLQDRWRAPARASPIRRFARSRGASGAR